MTDILRNALLAHMPSGTRPAQGTRGIKYTFDCPACVPRGYTPDKRTRGGVFFNSDGSEGYNCFNCKLGTVQLPDQLLTRAFRDLLGYMGMSNQDIGKLSFAMWAANKTATQGPPLVQLPTGLKTARAWLNENSPPDSFAPIAVFLDSLNDSAVWDQVHWTPDSNGMDLHEYLVFIQGNRHFATGWEAWNVVDRTKPYLNENGPIAERPFTPEEEAGFAEIEARMRAQGLKPDSEMTEEELAR